MADEEGKDIFWLNFRLADVNTTKGNYQKRYDNLVDALQKLAVGAWWVEGSSIVIFRYGGGIDGVVAAVKGAIAENQDIVLVGMPYWKTMRLIGAAKDAATLQGLVGFMKKV